MGEWGGEEMGQQWQGSPRSPPAGPPELPEWRSQDPPEPVYKPVPLSGQSNASWEPPKQNGIQLVAQALHHYCRSPIGTTQYAASKSRESLFLTIIIDSIIPLLYGLQHLVL